MKVINLLLVVCISSIVSFIIYKIIDYFENKYNAMFCKVCFNNAVGLSVITACIIAGKCIDWSIIAWLSLQSANAIMTELEYGDSFVDKVKAFGKLLVRAYNKLIK